MLKITIIKGALFSLLCRVAKCQEGIVTKPGYLIALICIPLASFLLCLYLITICVITCRYIVHKRRERFQLEQIKISRDNPASNKTEQPMIELTPENNLGVRDRSVHDIIKGIASAPPIDNLGRGRRIKRLVLSFADDDEDVAQGSDRVKIQNETEICTDCKCSENRTQSYQNLSAEDQTYTGRCYQSLHLYDDIEGSCSIHCTEHCKSSTL